MKTLRFIHQHLDQFRNLFWLNIFVAFLDGTVQFLIPVLLSEFTRTNLSLDAFYELLPLLIGCFFASLCLQWVLRRSGEALARQFGNYLRLKYFKILERLRVPVLLDHHSGYLLSLTTKVCDGSGTLVFTLIWLLAHSFATLCLFFIFTARESVLIALLNAVVLVVFLFISVLFSRKMVPLADRLNILHAALVERFVDLMANIFTVKKLGIFGFAEGQLAAQVHANHEQIARLQRFHSNRWFTLHFIYGAAYLSTIGFLLYQIATGVVSASVLILFISAFAVLRGHVERLSELIKDLLEMNAYVGALEDITADVEREPSTPVRPGWQFITMRNVRFGYPDSGMELSIPTFSLQKGGHVCITGESGQGKSTFLSLLARFLEPTSGMCNVDAQDFEELSRDYFRSLMSVVSQEVELFNLSLRENIALGEAVSDQQILEVLDGLKLRDWLEQLPEGLDTIVGEKGVKLSAGQKQRVNIARGVLLNREIILFDEATSHLDHETEDQVVRFLQDHLANKTAVFVSHRPAVEALCQRKYVFDDGVLTEIS